MKLPALRVPLPLLLIALFFLPAALQPAAEADGDDQKAAMSTLLVKLPTPHVKDLVAWVDAKGGRVVDTDTMTRLVPVGTPKPEPTPVAKRKTLPVLASARTMLAAANEALDEARGDGAAHTLTLQSAAITASRMRLKLVVANAEMVDRIRAALGSSAAIVGRARGGARGIEVGTLQRLKDGRTSAEFSVRFASPYVGEQPIKATQPTETGVHVANAAAQANMLMLYASSIRRDPHRKEQVELLYRDYQFKAADVGRLEALVHNLDGGGYTVTELQYALAPAKEQEAGKPLRITKPRVRLAVVQPLTESPR